MFFYQNYRDALDRIKYEGTELQGICLKAKLTEADLERFLEDERTYLERAAPEEEDDVSISASYILLLQKLYAAEYVVDHWHAPY
jgi:hypothetical protein